jgi:hypothetical protein
MTAECHKLWARVLTSEREEHDSGLTHLLTKLDRRFRLVGVLVERTVKEVPPAVSKTHKGKSLLAGSQCNRS